MVAAFDYCLHGRGGAAPSIDTATHGLVQAAHVDHLHPDSGIALATAADGEALTRECFGERVAWLPWRRPGFQLGLDTEAARRAPTRTRSGSSSAGTASPRGAPPVTRSRPTAWRSSRPRRDSSPSSGKPSPSVCVVPGLEPLADRRASCPGRCARAADPRARLHRSAPGRALHRLGRRAGLRVP